MEATHRCNYIFLSVVAGYLGLCSFRNGVIGMAEGIVYALSSLSFSIEDCCIFILVAFI